MAWEIRCLEQSLISEDGFFVEVLPDCEEKHNFPYFKKNAFKGKYLMLAYYFAEKR